MIEWLPLRQASNTSFDDSTTAAEFSTPMSRRSSKNHATLENLRNTEGNKKSRRAQTHANTNIHPLDEVTTPTSRPRHRSNSHLERRSTTQPLKRVTLEDTESKRSTSRLNVEAKSRDNRVANSKPTQPRIYSQHNISTPPSALKQRSTKAGKISNDPTPKVSKPTRRVSWDGSKLLRESSAALSDIDNENQAEEEAQPDSLPTRSHGVRSPNLQCVPYLTSSVDTVNHLDAEIVDGLSQLLVQDQVDSQNWADELDYMNAQGKADHYDWRYASPRQREVYPFVAQSVFFNLSSSVQLTKSFRRKRSLSDGQFQQSSDRDFTTDMKTLESTLRNLHDLCPCDVILNSLWTSLEHLFTPPKNIPIAFKSSRRASNHNSDQQNISSSQTIKSDQPLSDADAAHMLTVIFFTLVTYLPKVDSQTWRGIQQIREAGTVFPDAQARKLPKESMELILNVTDKLEHDLALRLVHRLVRALTARLAYYEISKAKTFSSAEIKTRRERNVLDLVFDNLREHHESLKSAPMASSESISLDTPVASAMIVEWIRTLFLKEWDGKPEIARSNTAGGAVQILSALYKHRKRLGLEVESFYTSFLSERLDAMDMPNEWLSRSSSNKTIHILSFTFLFRPAAIVKYFRAINFASMSKAYEAGMIAQRQASRTAFNRTIQIADEINLLAHLHTSMNQYFVISVRRDHVLQDAFNQIWRRERRELLKPLKVKLGTDLGEEGVDLGGVQQEFMTMAFAEAINPEHGMFTVDPTTRMTWFQPCSLERLEHFEMVGILMSLAVYNGLTLPVTFPLAFYRKLLDLKIKRTEDISDGWPELTKGLDSLLTWSEGDVGDVFMRSYEFSFEAFGRVTTIDMEKIDRHAEWPKLYRVSSRERRRSSSVSIYSSSIQDESKWLQDEKQVASSIGTLERHKDNDIGSFQTGVLKGAEYRTSLNPFSIPEETGESSLVTNANREQYVKDYLFWLTDKSIRPQYEAFARGFFTCIDRVSLGLFTPEVLRTTVEGTQQIDMDELQRHAVYDGGWDANHPLIVSFWKIVKNYSREQKARLLEFVTASDRVPVSGISSINFVIQRNGSGNDVSVVYRLLLLPLSLSPSLMTRYFDSAFLRVIHVTVGYFYRSIQMKRLWSGIWIWH